MDLVLSANETASEEVSDAQSVEENGIRGLMKRASKQKADDYERAAIEYNNAYTLMSDAGLGLYAVRTRTVDLMDLVEQLINGIANTPKDFSKSLGTISSRKCEFTKAEEFAAEQLDAARASALGAGAGVAAGMAVASMAPTAAMWIATTFGTASTGTAISTLSGAAATNAALAWLGGGALAAGGSGMAGGSAFLALAGPVGWGIAGVTILTSIVLFTKHKFDIHKKKHENLLALKNNTEKVRGQSLRIDELLQKTRDMRTKVLDLYTGCIGLYEGDYLSFDEEQKKGLGALVNMTLALSVLLSERIIDGDEAEEGE